MPNRAWIVGDDGAVPKVLFIALGSRGDVQPMAVLAGALVASGVDARVVAIEEYAPLVAGHGAGFVGIPGRLTDTLGRGRLAQGLARHPLGQLTLLRRWMNALAVPLADALLPLVERGDTLVAGVLGRGVAASLAETHGCRVSTVVYTGQVPTLHRESHFYGQLISGWAPYDRWGTRLNWRLATGAGAALTREVRRRLGVRRWGSRTTCDHADRHPTLIAASPLVVPPAPDWGPGVHQTGWLAPPPVVDVPIPTPELADFLARRPVHVGFGSLTAFTTEAEFDIVVEAARRSGVPVLTPAIAGVEPGEVTPGVHAHAPVPHEWLLPQVAAVVHHGGAGTTHAGLRAGVPSVAVPWGVDQPYHARRLRALGVGPAPISLQKLDADRLAGLLRDLTGSDAPRYAARAAEVGEQLRAEDGVGAMIALLDRLGHLG